MIWEINFGLSSIIELIGYRFYPEIFLEFFLACIKYRHSSSIKERELITTGLDLAYNFLDILCRPFGLPEAPEVSGLYKKNHIKKRNEEKLKDSFIEYPPDENGSYRCGPICKGISGHSICFAYFLIKRVETGRLTIEEAKKLQALFFASYLLRQYHSINEMSRAFDVIAKEKDVNWLKIAEQEGDINYNYEGQTNSFFSEHKWKMMIAGGLLLVGLSGLGGAAVAGVVFGTIVKGMLLIALAYSGVGIVGTIGLTTTVVGVYKHRNASSANLLNKFGSMSHNVSEATSIIDNANEQDVQSYLLQIVG